MQTTLVLLIVLILLTQGAIGQKSIIIKEKVHVATFTASKADDGSIALPANDFLPPILRSLKITPSDSGFVADGPFLDVPGEAFFQHKNILQLNFSSPRVYISLRVLGSSSNTITLRARAVHSFERPFGMRLHRSKLSVSDGVAAATAALEDEQSEARIITVINHTSAAESVGLSLPESSVVVFASPQFGSRLWPTRPEVGLDLPLEIVVTSSPLGLTYVGWNAYSLVRKRFGISGPNEDEVIGAFDAIHARVGSAAAGRNLKASGLRFDIKRIRGNLDGVAIATTKGNAVEAYDRLAVAVDVAPPVNIEYKFLHDEEAKKIGTPTGGKVNRVIVFGNPIAGTGIMQRSFTAALDLPLRISVWSIRRSAKSLFVGYTTAEWIGRRHNVEVPEMLATGLESFSNVALGIDA